MAAVNLRTHIVELLKQHHLLTVAELLVHLDASGRTYNKTSAYRALEQLLTDAVVCRHHFLPTEAHYELRDHHHDHLVCVECGRVQASDCANNPPDIIDGFEVHHHHTTHFGTCGECRGVDRT